MNHTTARFPRTMRSVDGTSCLGIDGPVIPTRPGWIDRISRWGRGSKAAECVSVYRLYWRTNGVRHAMGAVWRIAIRGGSF